jgi:hypothetical protein
VNCHGLVLDADHNIYLTYENENDGGTVGMNPNPNPTPTATSSGSPTEHRTGGAFIIVPSNRNRNRHEELCDGTPHGLTIATAANIRMIQHQYLYHANNQGRFTKTYWNGTISHCLANRWRFWSGVFRLLTADLVRRSAECESHLSV